MNTNEKIYRPSAARRRSLLGLLLAACLLPVLLGIMACFPVPVGDPEQSKVDPKMAGAWFSSTDGSSVLMVLEPFDQRTYLMTYHGVEFNDLKEGEDRAVTAGDLGKETVVAGETMIMKAWLTTIGGKTFMTWEPKAVLDEERGMKPETWFVFRVDFSGADELRLTMVDPDFDGFKHLKDEKDVKGEQIVEVIAKNVGNKKLYDDDFIVSKRIPQNRYGEVSDILERSGIASGE